MQHVLHICAVIPDKFSVCVLPVSFIPGESSLFVMGYCSKFLSSNRACLSDKNVNVRIPLILK